jgi:hypothetical protein
MMQQDPKKGAKDYEKPSVKEKLAQYSSKKKVGVGEMGKPDLKAGFEAAMQKERNTVLNRAKQREEADKDRDSEYREFAKRESFRSALAAENKNVLLNKMNNNIKVSKLKSMSKNKLKY